MPAVRVCPPARFRLRRRGSTSRGGPKTSHRYVLSGATRPTRICIVGRRARTRGLFLDRRAFLSSYDPTQDDADHQILTQVLQAVFPVCSGISLEYYFSYVDNVGWGCGTKLPHNVAALLGVMEGASSDLRTGLPWQMVEIHEPVRILFIIETTTRGDAPDHGPRPGHRQAVPQSLGEACRCSIPAPTRSASTREGSSGLTSRRRQFSPRRPRRWTGTADGAITLSLRRSRVRV